ncbi:PAS domain-containing hybrid sensor histidine kinase/response regulator [Aquabacterium sp. OR-4]|uniref:PAS domain-containing hybrid sensor histidine kinase/response regulator n=1 Tax=Aquabacterium sp. OR-4 TaxID=2978127 RepID=UPI0021B309B3|nr:PAS domain-containing hybrid sensor histidine kinase/response regulator [Aquabacterium sp. OR-4]MDT7835915.1 ATP-binding protein [Aquabacterium sp. OR-4]
MPQALDIRLLYLIAMLTALLLALAMHLVHRLKPGAPGVRSWQLGSAIGALGFALVALRGLMPDALTIVLANGLGVLGTARLLRGLREALGQAPQRRVEQLATAATLALCLYFTLVEPDFNARVRGVSAVYILLALHALGLLFGRVASADANPWCWRVIGLVVAAAGIGHGLRLLGADAPAASGAALLRQRSGHEALLLATLAVSHVTLIFTLVFVMASRVIGSLSASEALQRALVQRLRASEQQLETLVAQAPMAIAMLDHELRYIVASSAWQRRMLGAEQPLAGHRIGSHRRVQLPRQCLGAHQRVMAGETVSGESEPLQFDDEAPRLFDWSASPWRGPDGTVGGLILCVEEVTAREQAITALRESNSKFTSVFETGLVGMAINALPDGRFLDINDAWLSLLGYRRDQIVGRSGGELQLWLDPRQRSQALDTLMREGRVSAVQARLRHADGHALDALFSANLVQTDERQIFVSMLADVSALKDAQRSLQAQKDDLEHTVAERTRDLALARDAAESANRAKSAFLANMSHEIRTPLNGILGMAYLVRHSGIAPAQQQRLAQLEGAGRHLLQVINDVLDLSKIEAGGMQLEQRPFLADELEALVSAVAMPLAAAKGLRLGIDLGAIPPTLVGDSGRLAQALINLLSNAIKFTEQGRVSLLGLLREMDAQGCELVFEVSDSGIGMDETQLARIFKPFGQADSSVTRRYGGTGLGLVITRHLAEMMGGSLTVSSRPGVGSRFRLSVRLGLPPLGSGQPAVAQPDLQQARGAEAQLRRLLAGRPLLVVEDDPLSRRFMADLLADMGLAFDIAEDGAQAVALCAQRAYAAILMDLHMPTLGGAEAARHIRALPGHRATPLLAVTADAGEQPRDDCLRAGFDAVLHKPLEPARLVEALTRAVAPAAAAGG